MMCPNQMMQRRIREQNQHELIQQNVSFALQH